MLDPLIELDKQGLTTTKNVLILLDAMDESDDSGRGWMNITQLVATE